jgi:cytochrome c oxidase subunit II
LATATTVPTVLPVPDPAAVARGKAIFTSVGCSLCHTIQGVSTGSQGPNLTHIAAQPYDGLPNDPAFLRRWVANPQAIKPGTLMPDLGLSAEQVDDVVAYLGTLR